MVHRREVDGREIVLGNHGALWGNAMTWYDHGTGSVWSQPIGAAILGPLAGTRLELLPSTLTTWGDWTERHPDSLALDAPGGPSGFDLETMAVVVELGPDSVAHPVPDVRAVGVANSTVGDVPVAVHLADGTDNWVVLSRRLDDRVVELAVDGGGPIGGDDGDSGDSGDGPGPVLVEVGGPGRWDATTGLGLDGTDQNLDRLPGFTSFPDDYVTFFPGGSFWLEDGTSLTVADLVAGGD
jgi:hypothetical protein